MKTSLTDRRVSKKSLIMIIFGGQTIRGRWGGGGGEGLGVFPKTFVRETAGKMENVISDTWENKINSPTGLLHI